MDAQVLVVIAILAWLLGSITVALVMGRMIAVADMRDHFVPDLAPMPADATDAERVRAAA